MQVPSGFSFSQLAAWLLTWSGVEDPQVEVVHLSTAPVKSVLAGGRAVELLGAWLLEAATGGANGLASAILGCLDSLPIGMSALRTAKIGKTVSLSVPIDINRLASAILRCLDRLPIGMSALRTAKIGKTVSMSVHMAIHRQSLLTCHAWTHCPPACLRYAPQRSANWSAPCQTCLA